MTYLEFVFSKNKPGKFLLYSIGWGKKKRYVVQRHNHILGTYNRHEALRMSYAQAKAMRRGNLRLERA